MENLYKEYKTIEKRACSEFVEERSRFITNASYVDDEKEALDFISEIKNRYKEATHSCSGYIINQIPEIKRYNDDGEPQGSAGLPILSVLEKEEVKNIVVVVTRYFGGKLLGKGGLVRAYSKGVSDVLLNNIVYKRPFYIVELIYSYNVIGQIDNYISERKLQIIDRKFSDIVKVSLYIGQNDFLKIRKDLIDMTSANIKIEKKELLMLFTK